MWRTGLSNRAGFPIDNKEGTDAENGTDGTVLFLAFFKFFKKIYKNL